MKQLLPFHVVSLKHSSTSDSDRRHSPAPKSSPNKSSPDTRKKPVRQTHVYSTDEDFFSSGKENARSKSPKAPSKKKDAHVRRTSAESFNRIRVVDDKSIGSASGDNNELAKRRGRPMKSKTKDVQTNTDPTADTKHDSKGRLHPLART